MTTKKKSFNTSETASFCHVSPDTIRDWANRGMLKTFRTPGGHRRIERGELIRFLKSQGMPVDPELSERATRVLIVDDEALVAEGLARLIAEINGDVEVESALSGFDAGRKLQSFEPDLVLLDLKMPGLDGFDVCEQVKADPKTKHITVIAMTGYYGEKEAKEIKRLGAKACMRKPLDEEAVRGILEIAINSVAA